MPSDYTLTWKKNENQAKKQKFLKLIKIILSDIIWDHHNDGICILSLASWLESAPFNFQIL